MKKAWIGGALVAVLLIGGCSKKSEEPGAGSTSSGGGGLISRVQGVVTGVDALNSMRKMVEAKNKATSGRMKVVMKEEGKEMEMTSEFVCPDKYHTRMSVNGAVLHDMTMVNGMNYISAGGSNMKTPAGTKTAPLCPGYAEEHAGGARGGVAGAGKSGDFDLAALEKAKDSLKITKGGVVQVMGKSCQEWTVVMLNDQTKKEVKSYACIGTGDDLPYEMKVYDETGTKVAMDMTFWDWNKSIAINPPQ